MTYTSLKFLIFLAAVVLLYFAWPKKSRWIVLLIGSLFFYGAAEASYIPFMVGTALVSFLAGLGINKHHEKLKMDTEVVKDNQARLELELGTEEAKRITKEKTKTIKEAAKKKSYNIARIALIIIIGYLAYTKFAGMTADWIFGWLSNSEDAAVNSHGILKSWDGSLIIIVPLGISYYTFSTVGYVLDVYWKRYPAETNFFKYLLYVCYFPHILQGPIARYDRVGKQLTEEHDFDYQRFCYGMQLMVWGFFEKLVIADRLDTFVSATFDDCANQYGLVMLLGVTFWGIQIYTDFAGCVNIAMGMSQIFGIELENNFRQPYFSKSVEEFWRRWHITLGAWFKDYLCLPVSMSQPVKNLSKTMREKFGNEAGKLTTTICALIAVWICTGAWHGTGMNYIIWAAWQCAIIIIGLVFKDTFTKWKTSLKINEESKWWGGFQIARTFFLVGIVPRVVTRANSLSDAWIIFKHLFQKWNLKVLFDGTLHNYGLNQAGLIAAVISIAILLNVSITHERGIKIRETIAAKPTPLRWTIYILAVLSVLIFGIWGPGFDAGAFVYQDF